MSRYTLEQLTKHQEKRDEIHYGFIKHVLLMSSGLFGILVSLHKPMITNNKNIHIVFGLAISLIALGIILLTIALFAQVSIHKKIHLQLKDEIIKQLHDYTYIPSLAKANPSKTYEFCEKISYISFGFSIICLTIYCILIT